MSTRQDRMARVNRLIQTTLAEIIPLLVKDPRIRGNPLLSVNAVRTTPDLRHATVFLGAGESLEVQKGVLEALRGAAGFLRSQLGKQVRLRYIPELHFSVDETLESAARIDRILEEIAAEGSDESEADG